MAIDLNRKNELQWVKEGRVFYAQHGLLTTSAAFETDLVRQTPDLMVRVPAGYVIVPLRVQVVIETTGAPTDVFQCLISSCNNDPGTSNISAATITNCNTRYANTGSKVTAFITSTGNTGTAPAGVHDYLRVYVQPAINVINEGAPFEQVVYSPLHGRGVPAIIGDNSNTNAFMVYVGQGTSGDGFILAQWAEFTYTEFYAA